MKNHELDSLKEYIKDESSYQPETDDMNFNGQAAYLFHKMVDDIFEIAIIEKADKNTIYKRAKLAEELIHDFQFSIRYRNELNKNLEFVSQRYRDFMNVYDDLWYINNTDTSPSDRLEFVYFCIDELDNVIERYLSYDWLQSPAFENLIINAQVRILLMRFNNESMKDKLLPLAINSFILLAAIGLFITGNPLLIALSLILSYFLCDDLQIKFRRKNSLDKIFLLKKYLIDYVWSPKFLKSLTNQISKNLHFPMVMSLLSKLEKRNKDIFIVERMPIER